MLLRRLEIITPYPPQSCWPNARPHWTRKAAHAKAQRLATAIATRDAIDRRPYGTDWKPFQRASLAVLLHCPGNTCPDPDNVVAALKSTIDGLTDGHALVDDRELTILPVKTLRLAQWSKALDLPKNSKLRPYLSRTFLTLTEIE